ncbi:MAG: RNA methyltransferase [Pseudanabaenaceae cyanobacterium bins.39]|nr:RNA methyltransferase [Pseudanabaenaceae cyanobacterium bins.39]
MGNLRIVLVETAGARNLGSVARVMKNFGLQDLWLVNPQCDRLGDEAKQMAVHAPEILDNAHVVATLPQALGECQRAIATVGRIDQGDLVVTEPALGLHWLGMVKESAIVFGSEDRGLSNAEIQYCQQVVRIPVSPAYPSLNLAQAVGICCYQWYLLQIDGQTHRQRHDENAPTNLATLPKIPQELTSQIDQDLLESNPIDLASLAELEGYYQQLESVLLKIGYLYPHTAFHRLQKFRQIGDRANLTSAEVTMLRGVLRQINWATAHLDS